MKWSVVAAAGVVAAAVFLGTALGGVGRAQEMQMPMPEPSPGMGGIRMVEEPVPDQGVPKATAAAGGQLLTYRRVGSVKVFDLVARPVK